MSSSRGGGVDRSRVRVRKFVFGTPRDERAYGRVVGTPSGEERWISLPTETVRRLADCDDLSAVSRVSLGELAPDELPDGARDVDWRQLSVDLHVRTPLTRREADVYVLDRWFGLRRGDIAEELGISPNTVDNHLQNVNGIDDEMTELVVNTIQALDLADPVLAALPETEP